MRLVWYFDFMSGLEFPDELDEDFDLDAYLGPSDIAPVRTEPMALPFDTNGATIFSLFGNFNNGSSGTDLPQQSNIVTASQPIGPQLPTPADVTHLPPSLRAAVFLIGWCGTFKRTLWYFEECSVVLLRGECGTFKMVALKRVVWYFKVAVWFFDEVSVAF